MWTSIDIDSSKRSLTFRIADEHGEPISHRQFLQMLTSSQPFREFYNNLLADCGYPAFLWENKPVTNQNLDETYECTLVNSPFLEDVSPDRHTFNQYFEQQKNVVTFPNLGNDAQLIAPCPKTSDAVYSHIGSFVRGAGKQQINDFWHFVAKQMSEAITDAPRWLSTNGLGVFWLHVRIDRRPKYYQTAEYKTH